MKAAGLVFIENKDLLPWKYLIVFRKVKKQKDDLRLP